MQTTFREKIVLFLMYSFVLAGCGPQGEQIMIQNAKSAPYAKGYGDGCVSGRSAAGNTELNATKDTMLYLNNSEYKNGWDAGYDECKFREERISRLSQVEGLMK